MTLEDDTASIELVVFPKVYSKYFNVRKGQIVKVFGTVEKQPKLKLLVEEIGELK